ncbi:flagellar biosynthetic protein FliO [Thalassotalea ganghwensis]
MLLVKLNVLKSLSKFAAGLCLAACFNVSAQVEKVEVGKHANPNIDASAMLISLLMVLGVIIVSALLLKKFNLTSKSLSGMKVIASLNLGPKERLVVVEVQKQQLLLGVSGQQITLLKTLDVPMTADTNGTSVNNPLAKFLTGVNNKNDKN